MARRYRSKKGRAPLKPGKLAQFKRPERRRWKAWLRDPDFLRNAGKNKRKGKRY